MRGTTLVAVDKSIWASSAFNRAIEDIISKKKLGLESDLYILYVNEKPNVGAWIKSMVDLGTKNETKGKKILSFYGHKAIGQEIVPILLRGYDSSPGHAIVHAAEELGVNKIFIGSHGGTKVKKSQLGSTAKHVAEKAICDVVIIKSVAEGLIDLKDQIKATNIDYLIAKEKSSDKQYVEYYFLQDYLNGATVTDINQSKDRMHESRKTKKEKRYSPHHEQFHDRKDASFVDQQAGQIEQLGIKDEKAYQKMDIEEHRLDPEHKEHKEYKEVHEKHEDHEDHEKHEFHEKQEPTTGNISVTEHQELSSVVLPEQPKIDQQEGRIQEVGI